MSLLRYIVPQKYKVSNGILNFRKAQCNSCEFKNGKFCGTPIIGKYITYKEKIIKLCGCIINEKTELKSEKCPVNKW